MKRKAIISLKSRQDGDPEAIEVVTPGELIKEDGYYRAVYSETEISGMKGTTTTFKISPNQFTLSRVGSTSTELNFKKDSNNIALYNTPYGGLDLQVETKELDIRMDDNGGEVFIEYCMSVSGSEKLNTKLEIKIDAKNCEC